MKQLGLILIVAAALGGCAPRTTTIQVEMEPILIGRSPAPGSVETIWEEPMVDVVEVPPGLDPQGIYYRPAHQAVVEIRQGRWRYDQSK